MTGGIISHLKKSSEKELVSTLISAASSRGIHDLHLEPGTGSSYIIRARTGKTLIQIDTITGGQAKTLIADLRKKANLRELSSRVPQDGTLKIKNLLVQFTSLPVVGGEKVFLHITNLKMASKDLEHLGLSGYNLDTVKNITNLSSGLIITLGEGKTTTMFSLLSLFDAKKLNISTVESRQTYVIPSVNQFIADHDYTRHAEMAFSAAVRQHSDIIMLSQIDSPKLAELAVDAAMSGRLVITSLPIDDRFSVPEFMVGLGVKPFALAHVLKLIISQQLVKTTSGISGEFQVIPASAGLSNLIMADLPPRELEQIYIGAI